MSVYQRWYHVVRDLQGNVVPGAACTVYNVGTSTLATIYNPGSDDANPQPISNPFITGADGQFGFMALDGEYDISVVGGAIASRTFRITLSTATAGVGALASADLADTASTSLGDALVGVKQPFAGAAAITQHTFNSHYVNIIQFGAVGDGVTDNTAAIQNAINAGRHVYIPGTALSYVTGKLTAAFDGQRIFGDGYNSCLELKAGVVGDLFSTNGKRCVLRSITLYGGDPYGKHVGVIIEPTPASANDRNGIGLDFDLDQTIDNVIIYGFKNKGIHPINIANSIQHYGGTVITNSHIFQCWAGLDAGPNCAEYLRATDNTYNYCQVGVRASSGNQTYVGGQSTDNYTGFQVFGTAIGNNAHGSCTGMLINHNTIYAVHCVDVTNGFAFNGCQFFYGTIWLQRSTGVLISDGIYDVAALNFEGGGRNVIRNNFSPNGLTNTVTHNYSGVASNTTMIDNFIPAGKSSLDTLDKFGRPIWRAGDEPFLQFGEAGAMEEYGFQWTSNAGTGLLKLFGLNNNVLNGNPTLTVLRTTGAIQGYGTLWNLANYANDAAAAATVPVGGLYRNGSVVMVRVT